MDFVEKVKGFLMEPSRTFDASKEDTLEDAIKYYAVIIAVYSALFALIVTFAFGSLGSMMGLGQLGMMAGAGAGIGGALIIFVMILVSGIVGVFISGAIIHIGVLIVGGKKGITQTIKAVIYGSTPGLLLGWIPLIGMLAAIWSFVLEILGIRQLQEVTTGRAIIAVIIPVVILTIIIIIAVIAGLFFTTYQTETGMNF
ncbi:MAG: Yip1 family protein [Candidatus Methanoperedens sp.]|nr:Yip1 family protein [Candidatus Methanoperedens sp.]